MEFLEAHIFQELEGGNQLMKKELVFFRLWFLIRFNKSY